MKNDPHGTWCSPDGKYRVSLSKHAFDDMLRLARKHAPSEIGTALVGSYSDSGDEALVEELAPVSADSRSGRFTFHRGVAGLRQFLRRVFTASAGRTHYVGEWHSHVGGAPIPSPTDEQNMMQIASDPKAQCPECLLVIFGLNDPAVDLGVYVFSQKRGRIDLQRIVDPVNDVSTDREL